MKIGILCGGSHPVPPKKYGGVQAVNHITAEELVKRGHEVYLFAPAGSKTSGNLITIGSGWGMAVEHQNTHRYLSKHIDKLDVLLDTTAFSVPSHVYKDMPYLNRMGGDTKRIYCQYVERNIVFPSKAHFLHHNTTACSCGQRRAKLNCQTPVVYKPVCFPGKVEDIPFSDSKDNEYYLCLGLIQSHKGTHDAVDFARKAGIKLRVVGPIGDQKYFNKHVKPYLNDKITYEGPISFEEKWHLFDGAKATLFTTNCEEGGPNVPLESLLTGTPVIAFNRSTSMEYVSNKHTGLLCESTEEMADRLSELDKIKAIDCREKVLDKFGVDTYIEKYIKLMHRVIDGERWI